MSSRIGYHQLLFALLIVIGVALRVLLAIHCPTPFGYVYDYYHEAIALLYERGRLPASTDCWQCYHPPLFYLLSWPLYAIGSLFDRPDASPVWALRVSMILPAACGVVIIYYSWKLFRSVLRDRGDVFLATAL